MADAPSSEASARRLTTTCCIAGGGPAGMMLGLLLARAGIKALVLEKHTDFLRDFRGDTLHPSTLEIMKEIGLDEALLKLPHQKVETLNVSIGDFDTIIGDFRRLPVAHPYIMLIPQWDFLDFLADHGEELPAFDHLMDAEATGLIERDGKVVGLRADTPDGPLEVMADLVVDATGRKSTLRSDAGLKVENLGAPIDVFWFRLSRREVDTERTGGRIDAGGFFVQIFRGHYWQCAFVIPKGYAEKIRAEGIAAFRDRIAKLMPFERARADELKTFDDVKLLSVSVDRLEKWFKPGFLAIGDAAHAMSPVGGVGINLAIQDAVAAANILSGPLLRGRLETRDLEAVQRRRMMPTRIIQAGQVAAQDNILTPVLMARETIKPPLLVRLVARFPILARIPARIIGLGIRPEHVRAPSARPPHVKA